MMYKYKSVFNAVGVVAVVAALLVGCGDKGNPANNGDENGNGGGGGNQFNPNIPYGSFTDPRDNKTYRTVEIGNQTWMAENLNYNASRSVCYKNSSSNCNTYGRLYNWATAMGIDESYNDNNYKVSSMHRGICPVGWHLPSLRSGIR